MSKATNRANYDHRIHYNAGRIRVKSGRKIQKAYEWYFDILKKEQKTGMEKRILKTKPKALARLKLFGITSAMLHRSLDHKGLTELKTYIN